MLLIILAHTKGLNESIFLLRQFDVSLFVLISGYLFSYKNNLSLGAQLVNRFNRLIFPVWFFLIVYFSFYLLFSFYGLKYTEITFSMMLGSFSLINGIGYVWIIRVFLILAIVFSVGAYLKNRFSNLYFYLWISFIFTVYCVVKIINPAGILWYYLFLEPLPYLIMFLAGYMYKNVKIKSFYIYAFSTLSLLSSLLCFSIGYLPVKYPPNLVYLMYGLSVSSLLITFFLTKSIKAVLSKPVVLIGKFSMPIYLWHIPAAKFIEKSDVFIPVSLQFIIMLLSGCLFTYLLITLFRFFTKENSGLLIKRFIG